MDRPYRDADWLRRRYHDDGATQREIADECDVSPTTIRDWMKKHDIETREVRGVNHGLYGAERSEEVKEQISETMGGRNIDGETRRRMAESHRGNEIPDEVRERISSSLTGLERPRETRKKMSEARRGEKNPMYRDGESGTYGSGWAWARREVNERDECCQWCGATRTDARLEVHHIIPVAHFRQADDVELSAAHDLTNLILLCRSCHMKAEYGDSPFESGLDDPLNNEGL